MPCRCFFRVRMFALLLTMWAHKACLVGMSDGPQGMPVGQLDRNLVKMGAAHRTLQLNTVGTVPGTLMPTEIALPNLLTIARMHTHAHVQKWMLWARITHTAVYNLFGLGWLLPTVVTCKLASRHLDFVVVSYYPSLV